MNNISASSQAIKQAISQNIQKGRKEIQNIKIKLSSETGTGTGTGSMRDTMSRDTISTQTHTQTSTVTAAQNEPSAARDAKLSKEFAKFKSFSRNPNLFLMHNNSLLNKIISGEKDFVSFLLRNNKKV